MSCTSRPYIDNVSVTSNVAPVPEPASLALLGLGSAMLVHRRRRRVAAETVLV